VIVRAQLAFAAATLFLVLAAASAAADAPSLAVSDALVTEGDSGTKNALFTVSLSAASAGPVTVDYASADGSAKAPADYTATTGTLTFAAGELSKQVAVAVVGDALDELHGTYSLDLSNPVGATLGDARGAGTILDNDPQVSLSVDDVSAPEGGQSATVPLSRDRESVNVAL
jgi:chitinase